MQINKTPRDGSGEILPDLVCEVISWGRRQDCGHLSAFEKDTEVRSPRETVSHSSQEMQVISTINNINIHARKINTKKHSLLSHSLIFLHLSFLLPAFSIMYKSWVSTQWDWGQHGKRKWRIINFISSSPSVMTVTTAFRQIPRSTKFPKMLTDSIFTCSSTPNHNLFGRLLQIHDILNERAHLYRAHYIIITLH